MDGPQRGIRGGGRLLLPPHFLGPWCSVAYRVFQKTDPLDYFDDNFGKCGLILTFFSLLQQENYGAQNLSYFSHLTFITLPLYLAKQTLMLVSMTL